MSEVSSQRDQGPAVDDAVALGEWVDLERSLILIRLAGAVFGLVMVLTYEAEPYPPGIQESALALVAFLALSNAPIELLLRRLRSAGGARRLGLATLVVDAAVVFGFFGLFAFDETSAHYLLLFVLPAEAAMKFRLPGALAVWAASTAAYVGRDVYAAEAHGYAVNLPSAAFRMGVLLLVALVMGTFAQRLASRAGQLRVALRRLEAEERWRSALIDMLAHDLRSPIGTATTSMELLVQRAEALGPERVRELAEAASRQNRRALALADDLLELARAREDRLVLQRAAVNVRGALLAAIEHFEAGDDWVSVDAPDDLRADVDPARLNQILVNLLSNARKHGRPPVRVAAEVADGDLVLRVSDAGQGLSEAQAGSVFRPMTSGPRSDSVGLGLWIVRTLAEAHGGRVSYETVDERPTFVVRLPSAEVRTSEPPAVTP